MSTELVQPGPAALRAAPSRPRPRWVAEAGKLAFAAAVFAGVFGGYVKVSATRAAARDAAAPLPGADTPAGPCTLWVIGSSTIFRWSSMHRDLAPWDAQDRGVNGATLAQLVQWFGNEPAGRKPGAILFYAGENDIAWGSTPQRSFAQFRQFLALKDQRYGALPVIAISAKPSPARWSSLPRQNWYNGAMRRLALARPDLAFVDIRPLMFTDGHLGKFYVEDGIHMNAAGYARWTAHLRPSLARLLPPATTRACLSRGGAS